MFVSILYLFSPSPFTGLGLLLTTRLRVAVVGGYHSLSWLFLITVLVYVGGVIIIFVYITRVLSESKLLILGVRGIFGIGLLFMPLVTFNYFRHKDSPGFMWVGQGINFSASFLVVYRILYLFLALVIVFFISNKLTGPLKACNI